MIALVAAAAALLLIAGAAKLARPAGGGTALRAAGLRVTAVTGLMVTRALGAAEVVVGGAGIVMAGAGPATAVRPVAGLLAFTFIAVTAAALVLFRRSPATGCGCFGESGTPVGPAHLAVDAGLAVGCAVTAATGAATLADVAAAAPGQAAALVLCSLTLTWAAYLCLTALPRLALARRQGTA